MRIFEIENIKELQFCQENSNWSPLKKLNWERALLGCQVLGCGEKVSHTVSQTSARTGGSF
jgi:hypothetical protein